MRFFETSKYCVANISRCYSTSIAKHILESFYPEIILHRINNSKEPISAIEYKCLLPHVEIPSKKTIALLRHPIERFISAVSLNNTDIDETIFALQTKKGWQAEHPLFESYMYAYDTTLTKPKSLCEILKTSIDDFPKLNSFIGQRAILTKKQTTALEELYKDDISLYEKSVDI